MSTYIHIYISRHMKESRHRIRELLQTIYKVAVTMPVTLDWPYLLWYTCNKRFDCNTYSHESDVDVYMQSSVFVRTHCILSNQPTSSYQEILFKMAVPDIRKKLTSHICIFTDIMRTHMYCNKLYSQDCHIFLDTIHTTTGQRIQYSTKELFQATY